MVTAGYHWCYLQDFKDFKVEIKPYCRRKIKCVETGEVFNSIKELRIKYPSIKTCKIDNPDKSCNGLHFITLIPEKASKLTGLENIKDIDINDYKEFLTGKLEEEED